jgi:Zn-dependent protease
MVLPFMLAVTVHEVSHGYVAYLLGDNTAKDAGRLTLNPLAHIDPLGLICLLLTRMFGWAKPVPVNFAIVSRKKYGRLMVAAAGPLSNYLLAFISAGILYIFMRSGLLAGTKAFTPVSGMLMYSIIVNVALGTFNLIPIPPLDGGRIVENLLPRDMAIQYSKLEKYGFIIIIILLLTGALRPILVPVISFLNSFLLSPVHYLY